MGELRAVTAGTAGCIADYRAGYRAEYERNTRLPGESQWAYLQETVEALQRIGAERDHELLESIRTQWLGVECEKGQDLNLRGPEVHSQMHSITSFQDRHGIDIEFIADIAQRLYVYTDRELFVQLYDYVEAHKNELI